MVRWLLDDGVEADSCIFQACFTKTILVRVSTLRLRSKHLLTFIEKSVLG